LSRHLLRHGLSEAGCILAGVGYNAARGNWDAAINVRIFRIEFAQNWKVLLDNWNIKCVQSPHFGFDLPFSVQHEQLPTRVHL
jgi:hypothetical protein